MPTEPKAKWRITFDQGEWDVTRNGRAFGYNYASVDAALAAIKKSRRYQVGDKVQAWDEYDNRVLVRL